ncbi:MAG: NAD(P)H-binding protein, partial [Leptospiraceae bacterium]|nr:NAD(P)H-binding protein [Leptospiraceae bacterium]
MEKQIITIIGSTGTIGSELIDLLSKSGASIRAVMRNFSKVREIPGVVWVQADVSDASTLEATL